MTLQFGLALGGGGVKGLAHIGLLKLLDELEIPIDTVAGTSMGAILGGLYASGMRGEEIEERVRAHIINKGEGLKAIYKKRRQLLRWAKVFKFERARGGFVAADGLFEHLFSELVNLTFEELPKHFCAIACDFHSGQEVILKEGNLLDAIRASMAVPGVFAPQKIGNQLLVDGGLVNNLPCSQVSDCKFSIGSDVTALPKQRNPKPLQVISGAFSIMLENSTRQNLKQASPNLLFKADTDGIDIFDFHKIAEVLAIGDKAADEIRPRLKNICQ
jgi:NTE family protein